jgi:hypothetical protein
MRFGLRSGVWSNAGGPFIGGCGGMTAANATQAAAYYAGLAGVVFGLGLFAWGITVDGEQWWRRWKSKVKPMPRWVSLPIAAWYLIEKSEWSRHVDVADWRQAESAMQQELFDAAAKSEIKICGRQRVSEHGPLITSGELIPIEFWRFANAQIFFEVLHVLAQISGSKLDPARPAVWTDRSTFPTAESCFYGHVQVNTADMIARWPKAKRTWFRAPAPSALSPAFRQYLEEKAKMPEVEFLEAVEMYLEYA